MRIKTRILRNSGTIEVEKLRDLLYKQDYGDYFDTFITYCPNDKVTFREQYDKTVIFAYGTQDGCCYWLTVEFEPSSEKHIGKNRKIRRIADLAYYDPERDYRNG